MGDFAIIITASDASNSLRETSHVYFIEIAVQNHYAKVKLLPSYWCNGAGLQT